MSQANQYVATTDADARRSGRDYFFVALALLVAICVVAVMAMYQLRQNVLDRIHTASQNTATSIIQTIDGLFETVDVVLLSAADEIAGQSRTARPDLKAIETYLDIQAKRIPHLAFIRGTDALGNVVFGPGIPTPTVNLSDREFFRVLKNDSGVGLFVAKPVLGKIAQKYVMTLARRVNGKDGRFAGTVYASINVDELQKILQQFNVGTHASVALRDSDLGLIVRQVFDGDDPIAIGTSKISAPFSEALLRSRSEGAYTSDATSLDPVVRYYAYKRSDKFGYLVNVGVSLEDVLSSWWRQVWVVIGLISSLAMSLMVFVYQFNRSRKRREEFMADISRVRLEHQELLENLQTGVVVHAADTQIILANAQASELLGLTKDQMRGKTAIDPAWCFVDPNGQLMDVSAYPVNVVLRTREPIREMVLGVKIPGRAGTTWLQVSAFPGWDGQGQLQKVVVNFYDSTKRKEAEDRWRFALEGSGDGIWDLDMERSLANCSRRYYEMLGYQEGELPGLHKEWLEHVHPEDVNRVRSEIASQISSASGTFACEYRIRCKDGAYKWILARGMVVDRDLHGQPLRMVGANTDISALKNAEQRAWTQANFDALTGLPNRRLFYDRLDIKIRRSERIEDELALLFIDLDQFKEVNDTLGHQVGDALLIEAAQRIKACVRDYDTVARLGGDEFTVIVSDQTRLIDIGTIAQKIIDQVSAPYHLSGNQLFVSASIGIALYPADANNVNELIKNADQAMYVAKNSGRKRFCFFTKDMQQSALGRMRLVADLRTAVAEQQFEVYYQPIVDLRSGAVHKAEALVRWRHPERGLVSPAEFIALAEEIGAIHDIGDWVFKQAIEQLAQWQKKFDPHFQMSINKSPVQFEAHANGAVQSNWMDYLREKNVSGESVVIEITEGVLMDSDTRVTDGLIEYRDRGIQVAVDDFGTGYSSLSYLKKFDIDYLKIDQSFVRNLSAVSSDKALCEAIIVMAHSLGLCVIAEGVETESQKDLLKTMGCDFAQGYLFSRPMPVADFEAYLIRRAQVPLEAASL